MENYSNRLKKCSKRWKKHKLLYPRNIGGFRRRGAVSIKISGMGEFKGLKLDPEFLKEDPEFVSDAILQAIVDASEQAKKKNDDAMSGLTGGMQMPSLF